MTDNRGDMPNDRSFSDKVKDHWLTVVVSACITSGGLGWLVSQSVSVGPRDFEIGRLERENAGLKESLKEAQAGRTVPAADDPVALPETGVFEHASVTTLDGRCNILVKSVIGSTVDFSVTIDSRKPVEYDNVEVGKRVTVDAGDKTYFIDTHRTRGNIVDVSVQQHRK